MTVLEESGRLFIFLLKYPVDRFENMSLLTTHYSYKKLSLRLLVRIVDTLLWPALLFNNKNIDNLGRSTNSRFLIINCGGIGDLVLMEPLLRYIHQTYPHSAVDVIVRSDIADLCTLIPGVDGIIKFPYQPTDPFRSWFKFFNIIKRELKNKYEVGIDVKGDPFAILLMIASKIPYCFGFNNGGLGALLQKSKSLSNDLPKALANIRLLTSDNINSETYLPKLIFNVENFYKAEKIITDILPQDSLLKTIVVSLGAGEANKLWPNKYWQELLEKLAPHYTIIIIGLSQESETIEVFSKNIVRLVDLPLLQSIALIKRADLFIGLDTGLSHIAAAFSVPTICLFSLSHDPKVWAPGEATILTFTEPQSLDLKPLIVYDEVIRLLV